MRAWATATLLVMQRVEFSSAAVSRKKRFCTCGRLAEKLQRKCCEPAKVAIATSNGQSASNVQCHISFCVQYPSHGWNDQTHANDIGLGRIPHRRSIGLDNGTHLKMEQCRYPACRVLTTPLAGQGPRPSKSPIVTTFPALRCNIRGQNYSFSFHVSGQSGLRRVSIG